MSPRLVNPSAFSPVKKCVYFILNAYVSGYLAVYGVLMSSVSFACLAAIPLMPIGMYDVHISIRCVNIFGYTFYDETF